MNEETCISKEKRFPVKAGDVYCINDPVVVFNNFVYHAKALDKWTEQNMQIAAENCDNSQGSDGDKELLVIDKYTTMKVEIGTVDATKRLKSSMMVTGFPLPSEWTHPDTYIYRKGSYLLINDYRDYWSLHEGQLEGSNFLVSSKDEFVLKEAIQWAEKYISERELKKCARQ